MTSQKTVNLPDFVNDSADKLIASDLGPVERRLRNNLNMYLSSIEYIPFSAFLHDLWCLFANFINKHKGFNNYVFYDPAYYYSSKPETWVLVLFANFYKRMSGRRMFRMKKTQFFLPNEVYSSEKSSTLVYIWDLMDNLQCIKDVFESIRNITKVIFIVPYVGKRVKEDFQRYIEDLQQSIEIELMYLKEVDTYSDILKKQNLEPLDTDNSDSIETPIIFDHRIPYPDNAELWKLLSFYVEDNKNPLYHLQTYEGMFVKETNLEEDTFTPAQKKLLLSSQNVNVFSRRRVRKRGFDDFMNQVTRTFRGGSAPPASTMRRKTLVSHASKEIPKFIEDASENLRSVNLGPEPIELKYDRSFLNSYLSSIEHIRFNVFLHDLWLIFSNFLQKYRVKDCVFYDPELHSYQLKSNSWLNILFLNFYKRMNGVDKMTRFTAGNIATSNISKSTKASKTPPTKKTFVYIDDMIYSGDQVIGVILEAMRNPGVQKIVILVPYVSKTAYDNVWNSLTYNYSNYKIDVEIIHVKSFETFRNIVDKNLHVYSRKPIWVPLFLDHKVPDSLSTWNNLLCLHVDCSEPFYKTTTYKKMFENEKALNFEKFTDAQVKYLTTRRVQVSSLLNKVNYMRSNFDDLIDPSNKPYMTPAAAMTNTKAKLSKFTFMQSSLDSFTHGMSSSSKSTESESSSWYTTSSNNS